jgi:hypothetical protein
LSKQVEQFLIERVADRSYLKMLDQGSFHFINLGYGLLPGGITDGQRLVTKI